jgi:hypothetical protein
LEFVGLSIPLLPISWRRLFDHNIRPDFSRIPHSATAISQAQVLFYFLYDKNFSLAGSRGMPKPFSIIRRDGTR